jgi:hypothetical protein
MFDLEGKIVEWRASMRASLGDKADVIDELENHLREQLHRLALEGRVGEDAWRLALERLGSPQGLAEEFAKNVATEPLRWIAAWSVVVPFVVAIVGVLIWIVAAGRDGLLGFHVLTVSMGYGIVLASGALAIFSFVESACWGWSPRGAARLQWWALRFSWVGLLLTTIGVVTGALWARDNWGQFWNWDAKEMGGVAVITWNAIALWQHHRHHRAGMTGWVLGLVGNVVVLCAWMGSAWLSAGLHDYGRMSYLGQTVIGVVVIHAIGLALIVKMSPRVLAATESR